MTNLDLLQATWRLVTQKHASQTYGGTRPGERIPYINHLASVYFEATAAARHDPNLNAEWVGLAALLHDILEDTDYPSEELEAVYGADVSAIVRALTKDETLLTKEAMMADSLARIKATYREAAVVKLSDRICNLQGPPDYWDDNWKIRYVAEAELILETLGYASDFLRNRLMERIEWYEREFISLG